MTRMLKKPGVGAQTVKPRVFKVFAIQLTGLLVLSGVVAWQHTQAAWSMLLGGLIQCVPNWYFARQVFKFTGASAAHRVTQSFYRGELGKFILTGVGFALAFALVENLNPPALFTGFGLMIVGHVVLVPLINR